MGEKVGAWARRRGGQQWVLGRGCCREKDLGSALVCEQHISTHLVHNLVLELLLARFLGTGEGVDVGVRLQMALQLSGGAGDSSKQHGWRGCQTTCKPMHAPSLKQDQGPLRVHMHAMHLR